METTLGSRIPECSSVLRDDHPSQVGDGTVSSSWDGCRSIAVNFVGGGATSSSPSRQNRSLRASHDAVVGDGETSLRLTLSGHMGGVGVRRGCGERATASAELFLPQHLACGLHASLPSSSHDGIVRDSLTGVTGTNHGTIASLTSNPSKGCSADAQNECVSGCNTVSSAPTEVHEIAVQQASSPHSSCDVRSHGPERAVTGEAAEPGRIHDDALETRLRAAQCEIARLSEELQCTNPRRQTHENTKLKLLQHMQP